MKRFRKELLVILIMLISVTTVFSQTTVTPSEIIGAFDDFSEEVANSLPFNSTIGLEWSDAYIGQFPNFGLGITLGFTTIPYEAIEPITDLMGVDIQSQMGILSNYGFPFPAYTIDARLGGFGIPFDMGFKLGVLPTDAQGAIQEQLGMNIDYLLVGGDARFALLQNKGFRPDLSIGGGLYYLRTAYTMPNLMEGGDQLEIANIGGLYNIYLDNPDLYLEMSCWTIDTKVQASWKILILQPYIGAGASYGRSHTEGGLKTEGLLVDSGSGIHSITPDEENIIQNLLGIENVDSDSLTFGSDVNGWGFRAFGGLALKIAVLYIDLNAMYNFTSKSIGASASVRLQFNFHGRSRNDNDKEEE